MRSKLATLGEARGRLSHSSPKLLEADGPGNATGTTISTACDPAKSARRGDSEVGGHVLRKMAADAATQVRVLKQENSQLRQRLAEVEARLAELQPPTSASPGTLVDLAAAAAAVAAARSPEASPQIPRVELGLCTAGGTPATASASTASRCGSTPGSSELDLMLTTPPSLEETAPQRRTAEVPSLLGPPRPRPSLRAPKSSRWDIKWPMTGLGRHLSGSRRQARDIRAIAMQPPPPPTGCASAAGRGAELNQCRPRTDPPADGATRRRSPIGGGAVASTASPPSDGPQPPSGRGQPLAASTVPAAAVASPAVAWEPAEGPIIHEPSHREEEDTQTLGADGPPLPTLLTTGIRGMAQPHHDIGLAPEKDRRSAGLLASVAPWRERTAPWAIPPSHPGAPHRAG